MFSDHIQIPHNHDKSLVQDTELRFDIYLLQHMNRQGILLYV